MIINIFKMNSVVITSNGHAGFTQIAKPDPKKLKPN